MKGTTRCFLLLSLPFLNLLLTAINKKIPETRLLNFTIEIIILNTPL